MKYRVEAKKGHETIVFTLEGFSIKDALIASRFQSAEAFEVHKDSIIELMVEEMRD